MTTKEVTFGNYGELPLSRAQIRQRLSLLLGRAIWKDGVPFSREIRLPEQRVSRKPSLFENDLEVAFKALAAEFKAKDVPSDYHAEVILNDDADNHANECRDWLLIRVRLLRP
jgi:hypothetical protein